jgi:hypothetical protein
LPQRAQRENQKLEIKKQNDKLKFKIVEPQKGIKGDRN